MTPEQEIEYWDEFNKSEPENTMAINSPSTTYSHPWNPWFNNVIDEKLEDSKGFIFDFEVFAHQSPEECPEVFQEAMARPEDQSHLWSACSLLPSFYSQTINK